MHPLSHIIREITPPAVVWMPAGYDPIARIEHHAYMHAMAVAPALEDAEALDYPRLPRA